ncbi:MAG: iron-containing alcohol dehydrogenase [Lentisphaeria bacterium]|jgi:alcohol dehydrogenase class IV|nr:iron-containing alcohol dehydrogenase [Lentisphaeria bacterium]
MMNYDLLVPARTVFGWGRLDELGALARTQGTKAFVISGSRQFAVNGTLRRIDELLAAAGVESVQVGSIHHEPCIDDVDEMTISIRRQLTAESLVIGIGGGAALDLAKAVSATAANPHLDSVKDALEGVGKGLTLEQPPLPVLAVPTTSGTGSEATKNAVISSSPGDDQPFKKSLRADLMVPKAVLIDPELSVSVPADVTARTGMDAITQLIESWISCRAKPVTSALARHGLELAIPMIERAVEDGSDREAREAMAHAAYLSGICLANAGLGMAHGVAPALGILLGVPHGLACAVMLPAAIAANCQVRKTEIAKVGRLFSGDRDLSDTEAAAGCADLVRALNERLGLPSGLSVLGLTAALIPAVVKGSRGNSMNGNPRPIENDELTAILESML